MKQPAGAAWCARFPTSSSLNDLDPKFGEKVASFIHALQSAGAAVAVRATYRPVERAYLMHWSWAIARGLPPGMCPPGAIPDAPLNPEAIPPMAGVDIDWTCGGDLARARLEAMAMARGYGMAYPAALSSRHTQRLAVDMTVSWKGQIMVRDGRGVDHICTKQQDLWPIGASYGVHKLPSDPPHWSDDGH